MAESYGWEIRGGFDRAASVGGTWAEAKGWLEWLTTRSIYGLASLDPDDPDGYELVGAIEFDGGKMQRGRLVVRAPGTACALRPEDEKKHVNIEMRKHTMPLPRSPYDLRPPFPEVEPDCVGYAAGAGALLTMASADVGAAILYCSDTQFIPGASLYTLYFNGKDGTGQVVASPFVEPRPALHEDVAYQLGLDVSKRTWCAAAPSLHLRPRQPITCAPASHAHLPRRALALPTQVWPPREYGHVRAGLRSGRRGAIPP